MKRLQLRHHDEIFESRILALEFFKNIVNTSHIDSIAFGNSLYAEPMVAKYKDSEGNIQLLFALGVDSPHTPYHIIDSKEIYEKLKENEDAIIAEEERAMAAEKLLDDAIKAEVERATSAETILDQAIKAEVERAISAETALNQAIEDNKTSIVPIEQSGANVLEEFALKNKLGEVLGSTIKIYKDSALVGALTGFKGAKSVEKKEDNSFELTYDENTRDESIEYLYLIYRDENGELKLVGIDFENFLMEAEFGDGIKIIDHVAHIKIKEGEKYLSVDKDGIYTVKIDEAINEAITTLSGNVVTEINKVSNELNESINTLSGNVVTEINRVDEALALEKSERIDGDNKLDKKIDDEISSLSTELKAEIKSNKISSKDVVLKQSETGTTLEIQTDEITITKKADAGTIYDTNIAVLGSLLKIKKVDSDNSSIKSRYELQGSDGKLIGDAIELPVESALISVKQGKEGDEIDVTSGNYIKQGEGDTTMNFVYRLENGSYELAQIVVSEYFTDSHFGRGLNNQDGVVSLKEGDGNEYLVIGKDTIAVVGINAAISGVANDIKLQLSAHTDSKFAEATGYTDNRYNESISYTNEKVSDLEKSISTNVETINGNISSAVETLNETISTNVETINGNITNAVDTLNETISTNVETINDTIDTVVETLNNTINSVEDSLNQRINSAEESLNQRINSVQNDLITYADTLKSDLNGRIDSVETSIEVISSTLSESINSAVNTLNGSIENESKKRIEDVSALNVRIDNEFSARTSAISEVKELISNEVRTREKDVETLRTEINNGIDTLRTEISNGIDTAVESASTAAEKIAAEEVAKVVAGADTSYDTLKEIADWILNDTTGAAQMANDITKLKEEDFKLNQNLNTLSGSVKPEIVKSIDDALIFNSIEITDVTPDEAFRNGSLLRRVRNGEKLYYFVSNKATEMYYINENGTAVGLNDYISELSSSNNELNDNVAGLREEFKNFKTEVEDNIDDLKTDTDNKFETLNTNLNNKIDNLKTELNYNIDALKTETDNKFENLKNVEISNINNDIEDIREDISGLTETIEELEDKISGSTVIAELSGKVVTLTETVEKLTVITDNIEKLTEIVENFDELTGLTETVDDLKDDISGITESISSLEDEISGLTDTIGKLEARVKALEEASPSVSPEQVKSIIKEYLKGYANEISIAEVGEENNKKLEIRFADDAIFG